MNEDWGKSKMEIVAEAKAAAANEARKEKLKSVLQQYQQEEMVMRSLKVAKAAREEAVRHLLDVGVEN